MLVGFLAIVGLIYVVLGAAGEWLFTRVSPETEMRWLGGVRFAPEETEHPSPELTALVERLNLHSGLALRVGLICDQHPNAFAVPGGTILVTSGLLLAMRSENGLAFVVGHEIGHFVHRDHLRGLGRGLLIALAASLMGIDAGGIGLTSVVGNVFEQRFGRRDESAADRYALDLSIATYGHAWGAEELFEHLDSKASGAERLFERFESHHPPTAERLAAIRARQSNHSTPVLVPAKPFAAWVTAAGCNAGASGK